MDFPSVYTDEIGRMYCDRHRRDKCHECCLEFGSLNEEAEVAAGLRAAKSAAQVLAEELAMIEQDLRFVEQHPSLPEQLEYHQAELRRVLRQAKLFVGDEQAEYEAALLKAREKGRGNATVDPFTCSYCRTIKTERMPCCGRCKKTAYCCRECQKTHWKTHQKECLPVERLSKKASKDLPLTWEQLEEFGLVTEGLKLQVRFVGLEPHTRLVALCKDRVGVTKRVAAYTASRTIPGFLPGKIMEWKNPRFHYFLDGSSGARIEEEDLPNIKVK